MSQSYGDVVEKVAETSYQLFVNLLGLHLVFVENTLNCCDVSETYWRHRLEKLSKESQKNQTCLISQWLPRHPPNLQASEKGALEASYLTFQVANLEYESNTLTADSLYNSIIIDYNVKHLHRSTLVRTSAPYIHAHIYLCVHVCACVCA